MIFWATLCFALALAQSPTVSEPATEAPIACSWRDYPGNCQDGDYCAEQGSMSSTFSSQCTSAGLVCCLFTPLCQKDGKNGQCMVGGSCLESGGTNVTVNGQCDGMPYGVQCCLGALLVGIGSGLNLPDPVRIAIDPSVFLLDDAWSPAKPIVDAGLNRPAPAPAPPVAPPGPVVSLTTPPTRGCDIVAPRCSHMRNSCSSPFLVDREFMPFVAAYNRCARINGARINICSTYRSLAHNRRVGGASASNHLAGHAIDMYIIDRNGVPCTEQCLLSVGTRNARPGVRETLACLDTVRNSAWGGNPRWNIQIRGHLDVVHLDDRLNTRYNAAHVAKRTACDADAQRSIAIADCAWFEASASLLRDENDYSGAGDELLPEPSVSPSAATTTTARAALSPLLALVAARIALEQ